MIDTVVMSSDVTLKITITLCYAKLARKFVGVNIDTNIKYKQNFKLQLSCT